MFQKISTAINNKNKNVSVFADPVTGVIPSRLSSTRGMERFGTRWTNSQGSQTLTTMEGAPDSVFEMEFEDTQPILRESSSKRSWTRFSWKKFQSRSSLAGSSDEESNGSSSFCVVEDSNAELHVFV